MAFLYMHSYIHIKPFIKYIVCAKTYKYARSIKDIKMSKKKRQCP